MTRDHAYRKVSCRCDICLDANVRRDILRGIGYGLAVFGAVAGFIVALWVLLVLVLTGGPQ